MAVVAAHAAVTKSTSSAHGTQGAQGSAVPADEAALFAELLSKAGDASDAGAKGDAKATDPETLLAAQKPSEKSKKDKDVTDALVPSTADIQMQPSQLAALSAALSTGTGQPSSSSDKAANDNGDAVTPADDAKNASDAKALLNRMLDAKTQAPAGNNPPAKDAKTAAATDAADAAAGAGAPVASAAATTAPQKPDATAKVADALQNTKPQTPSSAAIQQGADQAANPPATTDDTKKATADTKPDAKAASKDAAKASTPTAADALAAAADKSVRQNAATQGSQARAVPVQADAQAAASQNTGGKDAGTNGKGSSSSQTQHAKNDVDTQPKPDAVQPASQAPINTAGTPQPAPHVQTATDNVQPVTAQTQTQTASPAVTASLQVAPQTAQHVAQPDVTGLAVQIAAKSDEGTKHFDIRLDPPELGRVEVKLSIDNAGQAQAHLTVEKPQTLDMLQNDRSSLERALKDSGVDLSQNGLNFSLKGQDRQNGNPQSQSSKSRNLAVTAAIEATSAAVAASTNSYATGDARLDIRV